VSPSRKSSAPIADFGLSPANPNTKDDIRLYDFSYDTGGIGISTRSWDFGDGDASTKVSPRHRFDTGGIYDVRLTVTTFDGRETSIVRTVRVRSADAARTRTSPP
jgi:PKD repeat protein